MKRFSYDGKTDELIFIEDGFTFPSMSKQVQYHETNHSSYRRRKRATLSPLTFSIPVMVFKKSWVTRSDLNDRLNYLLYSDGPKKLVFEDVEWYIEGEFNGPYEIPNTINYMTSFEIEFTTSHPYKILNEARTQEGSTITIDTKSQLPTLPHIELTGLTGDDVQISNSKADGSFKRIRLSGSLPAGITIDPENETLYRTDTGDERLDLLRIDSNFEDFTLEDGDVVTVNQGSAKLTYKELML